MTDLVIFDVDGTLVDSQGHIMASMVRAFEICGLPAPDRATAMGQVGRSLDLVMAELAGPEQADALADAYRAAYFELRQSGEPSPLYPGTEEMLAALAARPGTLVALATGKSRRGLNALIESYGWGDMLASHQSADEHPSKPHPSMILTVLADTGADTARTVMVGDTSYDIDMARNAGVGSIAVPWGYHDAQSLGADRVIAEWADLPAALSSLWEIAP